MTNTPYKPDDLPVGIKRWFDEHKLTWGQINDVHKISIGQSNPTYIITTDKDEFILRSQPSGELLPSAHAVDREYRVMSALKASQVPVPRMLALSDDPTRYGVKFFLMEKINGETLVDPALPGQSPAERNHLYSNKISILTALSQLRPVDIKLDNFGRPDGYIDRQIAIWSKQYRMSETEKIPAMERLIAELPGKFEDAQTLPHTVIHGDFRLDNMIIDHEMNVAALIDWELSTLGPAFVDLSYWCAMLRMQHDWPISGLGGINRYPLGIPEEAQIIDAFCLGTGLERPAHWEYWIAFQLFRFAAILQGVKRRNIDGNASAKNAAAVGNQAAPVAALGAHILNRL